MSDTRLTAQHITIHRYRIMSGPLTPPETQQPWRAYINTNGAIEEVDFVHNGSPTPTSSPFFKHKISQQRPDLDISQHSMLPLVEEDGDNRRRILLRNDDESRRIRNTQKKGIVSDFCWWSGSEADHCRRALKHSSQSLMELLNVWGPSK